MERAPARPGSLEHARAVRPGEVFVCRSPGQGGTGLCVAVVEGEKRRILVLWSNPEMLRWINVP